MIITSFQKKVYAEVAKIPRGQTRSYKQIALAINSSPRAVGQALKRNPFAPYIACHRIIRSDGERFRGRGKKINWNNPCDVARLIGGFNGKTSGKEIQRKRKLLRSEGVEI